MIAVWPRHQAGMEHRLHPHLAAGGCARVSRSWLKSNTRFFHPVFVKLSKPLFGLARGIGMASVGSRHPREIASVHFQDLRISVRVTAPCSIVVWLKIG